MRVSFERVTVAQTFSLEGVGIHSGHPSDVTVEPGTNGIRFRSGGDWIAATPENVSRTARSTWLGNVRTVEHLMSALGAFGVTDADVTVSAEELPILGGGRSSTAFRFDPPELRPSESGEPRRSSEG